MNNLCITGRVTRSAQTQPVGAKGTPLTKFSIENVTGYGKYVRHNVFDVQVWGAQGESIAPQLTDGTPVVLSGTLEQNTWFGQDGGEHSKWVLTARDVSTLEGYEKDVVGPEDGPIEF